MLFPLRVESRFMRIGEESSGPADPTDVEIGIVIRMLRDMEDPIITSSPGAIKAGIKSLSTQYDKFLNTLKVNTSRTSIPMRSSQQQWKMASIMAKWKSLAPTLIEQYLKGINKLKAQSDQITEAKNRLEKSMTFQVGRAVKDLPANFFTPIQEKADLIKQITKYPAAAPELSSDVLMDRLTKLQENVQAIHSDLMGVSYLSKSDLSRVKVLIKEVITNVQTWNQEALVKINQENDNHRNVAEQLDTIIKKQEQTMAKFGPSKADYLFVDSWVMLETIRENIVQIQKRKANHDLIDIHQLRTRQTERFGIKEFAAAQPRLTALFEEFAQQLFYRDNFSYTDYDKFKNLVSELIDLHAIWNLDISRVADQLRFEVVSIKKAATVQYSKLAVVNKTSYGNKFNPRAEAWAHQSALNGLIDYAMSMEGLTNISDTGKLLEQMQIHIHFFPDRIGNCYEL